MSAPLPTCVECGCEIAAAARVDEDGFARHRECARAAEDFRRLRASCVEPPLRFFTGDAKAFLLDAHPGAARRCGFRP